MAKSKDRSYGAAPAQQTVPRPVDDLSPFASILTTVTSEARSPAVEPAQRNLQRGAEELKALASSLDQKLKSLQRWLQQLEGRVETTVTVPDPAEPTKLLFHLRLAKGTWLLMYRRAPKRTLPTGVMDIIAIASEQIDWASVLSGSLDVKMAAIQAAPLLLQAMQESQAELLDRLRVANSKFDDFAARAGFGPGEGA